MSWISDLLTKAEAVTHDLGFNTPGAVSTVAGTPVTGLANYIAVEIEATLQGTDGTAAGGTTQICIQTSIDGIEWTDYLRFADVASGAAAIKVRFDPKRDNGVLVPVAICTTASPVMTLAASTFAGGHWGDQLRLVLQGLSGSNHPVAQVVRLKCIRPKR